jgi:hypothetical protein
MKTGLPAFLLFIVLCQSPSASAQSTQEDSIIYQTALANTLSVYYRQLGDQSPLYNGSHYSTTGYLFRTGTPYFLKDSFSNGSVVYDDILFDSLSLLYEDLRQLLVVKTENYLLQLVNQRITSFTISGHQFIRLTADSLHPGISRTGFYEILYQGHTTVLKETFKNILEEPSIYERAIIRHINETHNYYIKTGNSYRIVKSNGELLGILHDHQKDIQRFIKKNKLKFRKDKENTLIQVAGYYDQIAK